MADELGVTPGEILAIVAGHDDAKSGADDSVRLDLTDGGWAAFMRKLAGPPGRDGSGDVIFALVSRAMGQAAQRRRRT